MYINVCKLLGGGIVLHNVVHHTATLQYIHVKFFKKILKDPFAKIADPDLATERKNYKALAPVPAHKMFLI
jgi:hypothetical protein